MSWKRKTNKQQPHTQKTQCRKLTIIAHPWPGKSKRHYQDDWRPMRPILKGSGTLKRREGNQRRNSGAFGRSRVHRRLTETQMLPGFWRALEMESIGYGQLSLSLSSASCRPTPPAAVSPTIPQAQAESSPGLSYPLGANPFWLFSCLCFVPPL